MLKFLYYYLRSMRLYYGFVTATTVLAGLYYCHWFGFRADTAWRSSGWTYRDAALVVMGFFAWGFNQILSDWFDRKEDAINAPHRPMVTGELKPGPAFVVSALGLGVIAVAGYLLSPWTIVFLAIGGVLNITYSLLKKVPLVNCVIYACAISCCALFAIAGLSKRCPTLDEFCFVAVWIAPVHFMMCHNSYYKDVKGDRAAGVRTLQTLCPTLSLAISDVMVVVAVLLALLFSFFNAWFLLFAGCVIFLSVSFRFAVSHFRFHRATCINCQLCVFLLHFSFFKSSWPYAVISLVVIQLLFLWYNDEKE